jgi:hypothetical protein
MRAMMKIFKHEGSREFKSVKTVLAIFCAALQPPSASLIAAALEDEMGKTAVVELFLTTLSLLFYLKIDTDASQMTLAPSTEWGYAVISLTPEFSGLAKWLTSTAPERMGKEFWIDASIGHNFLCALYLKYCGNKSVGGCLFRMIEVCGSLCALGVIQCLIDMIMLSISIECVLTPLQSLNNSSFYNSLTTFPFLYIYLSTYSFPPPLTLHYLSTYSIHSPSLSIPSSPPSFPYSSLFHFLLPLSSHFISNTSTSLPLLIHPFFSSPPIHSPIQLWSILGKNISRQTAPPISEEHHVA